MLFTNAFRAFSAPRSRYVASSVLGTYSSPSRTWQHPPNRPGASLLLATRSSTTNTTEDRTFPKRKTTTEDRTFLPIQKPSSKSTDTTEEPASTKKTKIRKTQLKTDLKDYRLQQSTPLGKPAYTIFTNAALDDIYRRLPTTLEELLEVKGIGPKKLDQYGDDILSIVSQYTDVNGGIREKRDVDLGPIPKRIVLDKKSLTKEQAKAADLLLDPTTNGFVTGSAGTGKSHLLKYLVQELQRTNTVGVCAPTGVAAIHVGGSTLHSFFGIGLGTGSMSSLLKKVRSNKEALKRIDDTDVLIIDECSMLSSDLLETLDAVVRQLRRDGMNADLPFGGMRIVAFGDFFQLPPVSRGPDKPFCFESPVWEELELIKIELVEVQRQAHTEFVGFLNAVRIGQVDPRDLEVLNARCVISPEHPLPTDGIVPTRLYSLNRDVDGENEERLEELEGEEVICRATNSWRESMPTGTMVSVKKQMADSLSKEMPDEVRLKVGAQVMLTRNKDLERNLVNGSRGVVLRFDKSSKEGDTVIPVVRFDCGVTTSIPRVEGVRHNPDGGPGCLVRQQVPLKLAWALTVHKSQGTTLSRALLDISNAFEYGQCYVALSRVQSLKGLWLVKPARPHNIKVSPQVLDFYSNERRL